MSSNGSMARVRIALDAMGGDFGPTATVPGALAALQAHPQLDIMLVGDAEAVNSELSQRPPAMPGQTIAVVPSEGKIEDDEHPISALRRKPRSSIATTMGLLKSGEADMAVSVGSTGATMATAAMTLGLLEGLERPCIGGNFLGLAPNTTVVDLGSNVDCRPSLLLSFAALGVVFSRLRLGIENPRVALLSVGEESAKGNRQVQESHALFRDSHLNFVGNVEGMDFFTDKADVIVCDGFIGNILIKFAEGLGSALAPYLSRQLAEFLPAGPTAPDCRRPLDQHEPAAHHGRPAVRRGRPGDDWAWFIHGGGNRRGNQHRLAVSARGAGGRVPAGAVRAAYRRSRNTCRSRNTRKIRRCYVHH